LDDLRAQRIKIDATRASEYSAICFRWLRAGDQLCVIKRVTRRRAGRCFVERVARSTGWH